MRLTEQQIIDIARRTIHSQADAVAKLESQIGTAFAYCEESGLDPYNTGRFDRSKHWDKRFLK